MLISPNFELGILGLKVIFKIKTYIYIKKLEII